jgi:hypothetical protein
MNPASKSDALLRSIDVIIKTYANDNQELLKDLTEFRSHLQDALKTHRKIDVAKIALKIAMLVKFIYDHIPPPDI